MRLVFVLPIFLFIAACASNPNKVQNLKTNLEKAQPVGPETQLGVKDDLLVVQRKTLVAEELRQLQIEVHALEDHTYGGDRYYGNPGVWGALNVCRLEQASVANGGPGKMTYLEPQDYVIPEEDFGQIGYDEDGTLVSMSEEFLKDRIKRYQQYKSVLTARNRELNDKFEMCKLDLAAQKARVSQVSAAESD